VLGAPKPWSSVMMSSTLGAPFGGTTRGAHQAVDSEAFSLITPPNAGSGGGSLFPVDGRGGGGRARDARDLLSESGGASKGEKTHARENPARLFMVELPFRVPRE